MDKIRTLGTTSLENLANADHAEQAIFLANVPLADQGAYRASSNPAQSLSRPSPLLNATNLMDTKQSLSASGTQNDHSASQPGRMSSGDTAPGDTQVVSQSVFDSIIRQNKDNAGADGLGPVDDFATFVTLPEDDTGHVDLLSGFDNTHPDILHVEENDESSSKLDESSPSHYQPNLFPESQRFLTTTPARENTETSEQGQSTETPRASRNPITAEPASGGGIMALSQVFKATQAPSSPLVNGPQSDPMSDRPSPSIPLQSHPLADALSSPFTRRPANLFRKTSQPQYISMEESQAERERLLGQRMTRSADHINHEDQSDSEFNKEPSFVRRLRRQRMIDEEATAEFASLAARPTSSHSNTKDDIPRAPEAKNRRGVSREPELEDEPHEHDAVPQHGAISEVETEQDEDLDRPAPPALEPDPSTEEDKENYNEPSASSRSAVAGSHDRVSPAIAVPQSQSQSARASDQELADSLQCSRSPDRVGQTGEVSRSSQGFVVKDSQQSVGQRGDEDIENTSSKPRDRTVSREPLSRMEMDTSDRERVVSSPTMMPPPRSSPPSSAPQQNTTSLHEQVVNTDTGNQTRFGDWHHSSNTHEGPSTRNSGQTHGSNSASQRSTGINHNLGGKSSSILSQVAETPVHQQSGSSRDMATTTSIPETTPNRSQSRNWSNKPNGDAQNQEDDDLPPMHPAGHDRASDSRPSDAQRSLMAVKKLYNQKILSSPSGRQRRALTEIAADLSPQTGLSHYDVDIGILTAEDQEFSSLLATSPIPRKKRRTNMGRNVYASDPVLPVTSHAANSQSDNIPREETIEEEPEPPESPSIARTTLRTRPTPLKRAGTMWEVSSSQQSTVSRVGRPPKVGGPRRRGRPPLHARKYPPKDAVAEAVVIHNRSSIGPSRSPSNVDEKPRSTPVNVTHTDPQPTYTDGTKIMCNQVLGLWPGKKLAYYPGTCFGAPIGTSPSRYLVKFEDSDYVEVSMSSVKKLELRIGDAVKIEMPDVPKITHIIRGFANKLSADEWRKQIDDGLIPITDVYGHSSVVLGPKQRKSLPNGGLAGPESTVTVPISKIYMDTILWNQLKDREFTHSSETAQSDSRLRTPSELHSTPASPSARRFRDIHAFTGLFSGMVFAVSYVENDDAKSRVTSLILENGGHILMDGFNELFEFPSNVPIAAPANPADPSAATSNETFRLTSAAEGIGFACLIADKHSRRVKYMQALALNLPCLSGRWIEDCLAQGRVLDWGMYLLPSGESMYLDGATKSRLLTPTPAATARISSTIAGRPNMLDGQSVLLVMGRGKAEEKRKAYIFLTYALGASKVERVFDLKSAKAVLDLQAATGTDDNWDWIYVDDDEQDAARSMILGGPASTPQKPQVGRRGRKRKRAGPVDSAPSHGPDANTKARIVGNEFLCQSLILGRLFE